MNYEAIALWSQVIAAVVFAAIIIWGFIRFITPAINHGTAAKNEEIRENEQRRDEAVKQVEVARAEVERAKADAEQIRRRIEHDARREAEDILAEANAEAQRLVRNAHGEYERQRLAARDKLRIELIERALAEARKKAAAQIDAPTDLMLVDRFIADLERKGSAG
jgi:F0F1-type ATP synthase membrane subunit b/b'